MGTHYATDTLPDNEVEELAVELGVTPDVLVEARLNVLEERIKGGRPPPLGPKRAGSGHYQVELWMPETIFHVWKHEAERRGLDGSALLRSMIHAYLRGSWEPESTPKHWVWRGQGYDVNFHGWRQAHGTRYPYRERALITSGAKRALGRRASRLAVRPASVLRALVLDVIEGNWASPGAIAIVDASGMFDDEEKYFLGE